MYCKILNHKHDSVWNGSKFVWFRNVCEYRDKLSGFFWNLVSPTACYGLIFVAIYVAQFAGGPLYSGILVAPMSCSALVQQENVRTVCEETSWVAEWHQSSTGYLIGILLFAVDWLSYRLCIPVVNTLKDKSSFIDILVNASLELPVCLNGSKTLVTNQFGQGFDSRGQQLRWCGLEIVKTEQRDKMRCVTIQTCLFPLTYCWSWAEVTSTA